MSAAAATLASKVAAEAVSKGASARRKCALIDTARHTIIESAHPSPLSARLFFGSKAFSKVNDALTALGKAPIDWQIPNR